MLSVGDMAEHLDIVFVDPRTHSANQVGDEPLLISQHAKVWVSKKRKKEF